MVERGGEVVDGLHEALHAEARRGGGRASTASLPGGADRDEVGVELLLARHRPSRCSVIVLKIHHRILPAHPQAAADGMTERSTARFPAACTSR